MIEGRTFNVTKRLSGEECAATSAARCEYIPIRSAASSLKPKSAAAPTLGYFSLRLWLWLVFRNSLMPLYVLTPAIRPIQH